MVAQFSEFQRDHIATFSKVMLKNCFPPTHNSLKRQAMCF